MPREIHIHVEEPSMKAFLDTFLPRQLNTAIAWRPIDYSSKQQLLSRFPKRLLGYARMHQLVRPLSLVLIDRDRDDCHALKQRLENACAGADLHTISRKGPSGTYEVVNRIVVEELEAWFFGDPAALDAGWPGAGRIANKAAYRDPDAITGGTHEALLREFQRAGHFRGQDRLPKIETARTMGSLIDPARNVSRSFRHFWDGLNALAALD